MKDSVQFWLPYCKNGVVLIVSHQTGTVPLVPYGAVSEWVQKEIATPRFTFPIGRR